MTCTQQFWEFFRPIAEQAEGVKTVMQSGGDKMDRLMGKSVSSDIYPAAFLLRPKYSVEDNGAGLSLAWFDANYYLICTGNASEEDDEDRAFDEAEALATGIYTKIRQHVDDYTVVIDPMTKVFVEPVTMVGLDSSYGYEVRFRIGLMVDGIIYEAL